MHKPFIFWLDNLIKLIIMEAISITNPPIENSAPSTTQFNGFYRGRVIEHGKYGTCKIWIPEVYPPGWKLDPKKLPLAEQAQPFVAFGAQPTVDPENPDKELPPTGVPGGIYSYPAIGSYVLCCFLGGSIEHPVYFAAVPSLLPESKDKWEKIELSKSAKGFLFTCHLPKDDLSSETGEIEEATVEVFTKDNRRGVSIKVFGDNKDKEKIIKNEIKITESGITLFSTGAINIQAGTDININAKSINLMAENITEMSDSGVIKMNAPIIAADVTEKKDGHYVISYYERFKGKLTPRTIKWVP